MSDYLDAMGAYLADGGFGLYQPGSGVPTIFVLRSFDFLQEDGQRRTEYTIEFEVWLG
jgi:hypothetical protein